MLLNAWNSIIIKVIRTFLLRFFLVVVQLSSVVLTTPFIAVLSIVTTLSSSELLPARIVSAAGPCSAAAGPAVVVAKSSPTVAHNHNFLTTGFTRCFQRLMSFIWSVGSQTYLTCLITPRQKNHLSSFQGIRTVAAHNDTASAMVGCCLDQKQNGNAMAMATALIQKQTAN